MSVSHPRRHTERHIPQTDVTVRFTLREAAELHNLFTQLMIVAPDHSWSRPLRSAVGLIRAGLEHAGARHTDNGDWVI